MSKHIRINGKLYESVEEGPDFSLASWGDYMLDEIGNFLKKCEPYSHGNLFAEVNLTPKTYKKYLELSDELEDALDDLEDLYKEFNKLYGFIVDKNNW